MKRMLPQRFYPLVGLVVVFLALCFPLAVKADAAPPQAPPGSTIATNDFETHVQMVSEEVTIDVQTYHGPAISLVEGQEVDEGYVESPESSSNTVLSNGDMVGHVTASFIMQNQGDAPESFDVWFPIGASDGYGAVVTVANFQAWVNGSLVETGRRETEGEFDYLIPWATWPVDFPVGEQVQLTVTYDLPATLSYRQHQFKYILETGSGWWGVIESGTFTFRLPYEATPYNAILRAGYFGRFPIYDRTYSGNEVRWEFTNLEPGEDDNLQLTILDPSIWEGILSARAVANANPNSVESQLNLARTLKEAMTYHHGIVEGGQFAPEAIQAYENALALVPDDVDIYVEYIDFLFMFSWPNGPVHSQLEPTLMRALEIAPDNERLLEQEEEFHEIEQRYGTAIAYLTSSPTAFPTATSLNTPTPMLTLTPTPPASTPTLAATTDAPPPPTPGSGGFPAWVVIAGSAAFLFALAIVLRGQADDDKFAPGS